MKIEVDESMCQGSGYCEQLAPQIFELVNGVASVKAVSPVDDSLRVAVLEAEAVCPAGAIRL